MRKGCCNSIFYKCFCNFRKSTYGSRTSFLGDCFCLCPNIVISNRVQKLMPLKRHPTNNNCWNAPCSIYNISLYISSIFKHNAGIYDIIFCKIRKFCIKFNGICIMLNGQIFNLKQYRTHTILIKNHRASFFPPFPAGFFYKMCIALRRLYIS